MKINIGDVLVTANKNTVLITDIKVNGMLRGIYSGETDVRNVRFEANIIQMIKYNLWKHYPVKK
jgi:hypothetical protein